MAGNGTITSANAIFMLGIASLFPIPQQLQGFSADDIFDSEPVEPAEVQMGVDGHLAAGIKLVPTKQGITLMADSDSNGIFEFWYQSQLAVKDLYFASATVQLLGIGKKYTMTRGVLTRYPSMSDAKTVLQPRKFEITWEKVSPQNI
jgi:hypothetical protein